MNYKRVYDNLISTRLSRGLDKSKLEGYYEKHHIVPRCMGGLDEDSNYVLLTAKEHILAHLLLHEIYPEELGLASAIFLLTVDSSKKPLSLRTSSKLREEYGSLQKIRNISIRESSKDGYVLSEETRKRMSESRKGRLVIDETRLKISISETGKVVTNKTRKLLSESYRDTKERRDKLSDVAKNRMKNPINREKISTTLKSKINLLKTGNKIVTDGINIFESIKDCLNFYKISRKELDVKLNDPDSNFKILKSPRNKKIVGPKGEIYNSLNECSKQTGHSKKTIRRWLKDYPEKGYKEL